MHNYQLLFTCCFLKFIGIVICIIQTKFLFLFIIAIIYRLFFHFVITLEDNMICNEGIKALAKALKLNKNLANINLRNFLRLFGHIIQGWQILPKKK